MLQRYKEFWNLSMACDDKLWGEHNELMINQMIECLLGTLQSLQWIYIHLTSWSSGWTGTAEGGDHNKGGCADEGHSPEISMENIVGYRIMDVANSFKILEI